LRFAGTGLIVLLLVGFGGVEVLQSLGRDQAIREAESLTQLAGEGVVAPAITLGLMKGDPAAVARMDRVVARIIKPPVVRVKLWDAAGRIVYSDEHRLIGSRYRLPADEVQALLSGRTEADISQLNRPENRFERGNGKLMEVYLGISTPTGRRLLFETYQHYSSVTSSGKRLWHAFLPVLLGALGLLALLQIPLAWSLARRVTRAERERLKSLERSIDAQQQERRRIAGDLHDGVVQTLAGVSFRLAAAREHIDDGTPPPLRAALSDSARETRDSIRALRSLLVDIYPPSLQREGLAAALEDLMTRAAGAQLNAHLEIDQDLELPVQREALLFRAAQEALRNAVNHARATDVNVAVTELNDRVVLSVRDNGGGFDAAATLARAPNGHFGLRALDDLIRDQGGSLDITSAPGSGTTVRVEVPSS
jgi:signal transduction histidine kinase